MRKHVMVAAALITAVSLSGCDMMQQLAETNTGNGQQAVSEEGTDGASEMIPETVAEDLPFELSTEDTEAFIVPDTGDILQTEDETEPYYIVPDTETEQEAETEKDDGPITAILDNIVNARTSLGEHWSIGYEDLETGAVYGYQDGDVMQSASVVKLFIMGAVYRYMCYPPEGEDPIEFHEEYDGHLRDTISNMITVSDNDAANLLIERLGGGDFQKGAELIGQFCADNGYTGTSIGRRFLDPAPSGDNYTSAADTRKFLSDLYHGRLVNEEASAKMLQFVMNQTRRNKIPSGLPAGFTCGNKTGEMPEGYNLGCIENDAAIVLAPEGMGKGYVLTVLSNDLAGRNEEAIQAIVQISAQAAAWYTEQHS